MPTMNEFLEKALVNEKIDPELQFAKKLANYLTTAGKNIYDTLNKGERNFSWVAGEIDDIKKDMDLFKKQMKRIPSTFVEK